MRTYTNKWDKKPTYTIIAAVTCQFFNQTYWNTKERGKMYTCALSGLLSQQNCFSAPTAAVGKAYHLPNQHVEWIFGCRAYLLPDMLKVAWVSEEKNPQKAAEQEAPKPVSSARGSTWTLQDPHSVWCWTAWACATQDAYVQIYVPTALVQPWVVVWSGCQVAGNPRKMWQISKLFFKNFSR